MKGNLLLFATSIVKLIAGCASFNVARIVVAVEIATLATLNEAQQLPTPQSYSIVKSNRSWVR